MSAVAVRCEGIGKRFRAGDGNPYRALHAAVERMARAPFQRGRDSSGDCYRWALRDVSFEVRAGEVFGILGGNGAGKSVLLKILSRVTRPTEGRAEINGSLASILQLGIVMHPELTGRENIYQSGTLLRLKKGDVERRFSDIVEFAGVEQFIDMPVKQYSLGMQLRLSFAAMAELDTEILLIDEALSVGDEGFRQRSWRRMQELVAEGRTILIVSHELDLMERLCDRAMVLEKGRVKAIGAAASLVKSYRREMKDRELASLHHGDHA